MSDNIEILTRLIAGESDGPGDLRKQVAAMKIHMGYKAKIAQAAEEDDCEMKLNQHH